GVPVTQSVELWLEAPWPKPRPRPAAAPVIVSVGNEMRDLPKIGIEICPGDIDAGEPARNALRAMSPALLHLSLDSDGHSIAWEKVKELLTIAHARLRLDVALSVETETVGVIESLHAALAKASIVPESLAIFPSERRHIDVARAFFPESWIGGGTPYFFVQLNRLENIGGVDFLTFTTSSIVHGADDETIMGGLQSLPSMIQTLRARYPGLPVRVGPSGIATRRSPLGRHAETDGTRRIALARNDPRCRGLYGAGWLLGYVAQLLAAGVDAISAMSLTGPSGLVAPAQGSGLTRYPASFVLERLRPPARLCTVSVSDPLQVAAVALARKGMRELLVANLTGHAIDLDLECSRKAGRASVVDSVGWDCFASRSDASTTPWHPLASPWRLEPYAFAAFEFPA
ncbi:MAG: hypothetical protein ACRETU_13925, partial [Steroidobacterales bacterium]